MQTCLFFFPFVLHPLDDLFLTFYLIFSPAWAPLSLLYQDSRLASFAYTSALLSTGKSLECSFFPPPF